MNSKKLKLIILSSLYSLFACLSILWLGICIVNNLNEPANMIVYLIPIIFIIMTTISLWLLVINKSCKASYILLRIKGILKYIYIIVISLFVILLLLVIQDCSNSISSDKELNAIDKLLITYPFIILIIFSTIYFVFHNIMLTIIKCDKPNKIIMMIYIVHNGIIILGGLILIILELLNKTHILTEVIDFGVSRVLNLILLVTIFIYMGVLGFGTYLLIEKTYKQSDL